MDLALEILSAHFPNERWTIEKPSAGLSKESYIAKSADKKLFLKFDVDTPALKRLSELGVTPPVLIVAQSNNRPYIIQEFVEGVYPDREWFNRHLDTLASFIKRYQRDERLKDILSMNPQSYADHIQNEFALFKHAAQQTKSPVFEKKEFIDAFSLLQKQASALTPVPLVPVHADPNYKNILVTPQGIMMIDWDDIILSDPMRDIGLLLWWYVYPDKWPEFFQSFGTEMDTDKIYWWVAKRSLAISLWFAVRNEEQSAQSFLQDFYLAIEKKDNPKMKEKIKTI